MNSCREDWITAPNQHAGENSCVVMPENLATAMFHNYRRADFLLCGVSMAITQSASSDFHVLHLLLRFDKDTEGK